MKRIIRLSYITLLLVSSGAWAQTANISGLVTDTSGQPVIGASVIDINDRTIGTITDIDGRYTIASVLPNSTLEFSCIGYKTIRETINGRSTISVILEDDSEFLDEVVVVGYGTVRKKDLTGAVASVGDDAIKDKPVANIGQALQGKVSGVHIVDNGAPGENVSIKIRGLGTIKIGRAHV